MPKETPALLLGTWYEDTQLKSGLYAASQMPSPATFTIFQPGAVLSFLFVSLARRLQSLARRPERERSGGRGRVSVPEFPCTATMGRPGINRKDCAWLCPGPGMREEKRVGYQLGVQKKPTQANESLEGDSNPLKPCQRQSQPWFISF